ncbi:MAG TPA: sigma-54 dependent transcriptional regulator [Thermoanaerobaculia bacterium]|nr:sigma-54 dependent transcriptional regulator [Thermoanaerobaculia bacterium]
MPKPRILLVDDEPGVRFGIQRFLQSHDYEVEAVDTCERAQGAFALNRPDVLIIDYMLPDGNALDILPQFKAADPSVPILLLTGHGTIDLAVRAIKVGADQFLTKPVELPALLVLIERVLENERNRTSRIVGESREAREAINPFLGSGAAISGFEQQVRKIVQSDSPVLIHGETGTGKGVLAKWLHQNGPRANEAFVDLNCAGLTREFLETELFGHEKGAFTGAVQAKRGLLEVAHRGTVFLDEIGDVDLQIQPKLLKVLEEKRFRRVGDVKDKVVDVRLVAATHHDLAAAVGDGRFRNDLYFRINTIPLTIPTLRDRPEDIPLMAELFLRHFGRGRELRFSADAVRAMQNYAWPGNIRELRNVIERAVLIVEGPVIDTGVLRFEFIGSPQAASVDTSLSLEELEKLHIEKVLAEEHGKVEPAARRLGIPRSSLYQKIKRFGLKPSRS